MTAISVPVTAPFRFDLALNYLGRSPDEVIDFVREDRHYRVIGGANGASLVEVSVDADDAPHLNVRVLAGNADTAAIQRAIGALYQTHIERLADLDDPLATSLAGEFRGLPVLQTLSPWEALVWAVIGQQINIAFAYRLKRAFVEQFGERLTFDGHDYFAFPTPERVALLDHERDLRPIQFSRQKSRYIIEAAHSVNSGDLDFERIATLDDEAASAALQRQLGIGRWTAEYILLRGFGRLDVIPAGDAALKIIVGKHLGLGRSATEEEVRNLAEHWIPRRGEIAFMLWFAKQSGWFKD